MTIDKFNKNITVNNDKITAIQEEMKLNIQRTSIFQTKCDQEIEVFGKKLGSLQMSVALKADLDEITKVYEQFQRFAEYEDLKKLHKMVIPEI